VKTNISGVVFDFGRVLTKNQDETVLAEIANRVSIIPEILKQRFFQFRKPYDQGIISAGDYWNQVLPDYEIPLSWLIEKDLASWSRLNSPVLTWFESLVESGIPVALLSNMPLEGKNYFLARVPILKYAKPCLFSCDTKCCKPEPQIYTELLRTWKVAPSETLFIDDMPENIKTAVSFGIQAELCTNPETIMEIISGKYLLASDCYKREINVVSV